MYVDPGIYIYITVFYKRTCTYTHYECLYIYVYIHYYNYIFMVYGMNFHQVVLTQYPQVTLVVIRNSFRPIPGSTLHPCLYIYIYIYI